MSERENELFEDWWENEGQYNRAGGGDYEKTFAYYAWMAVVNRQGHKLVPVDTLGECLNWAACAEGVGMREEFEKLPSVAKYLPYVFFNDETKGYCNKSNNPVPLGFASFLNGAYYAFQEQQKKIDKISDSFDSFLSECELWGFDSDQADRQLEIIQELLK